MKYNLLGKTGLLVSELCFGTMSFGGQGFWEVVGKQSQTEANELIKTSFDAGINFFDTANVYSFGMSEQMLGEAIRNLGLNRQELVVATKVRGRMAQGVNQVGLSRYHIMNAAEDSLRRLGTDYIDLYYIHGVDKHTPMDETLRALEDLVRSGKVRYLGVSNHAAWQIMKALAISDKNGWSRFEASQSYYSIGGRYIEREIIPVLQDQQMALIPWSPLAGGFLSGKYTREKDKVEGSRRDSFDFPPINKEKAFDIIDVMLEVGENHGVSAARVALAWMLSKKAVTSIIIGAKRISQLKDNLAATELQLSVEDLERLDEVSALSPEYPAWMIEMQNQGRLPELK
ncbi:MAG: aldo/keto reductase [Chitinophagales bacterium]